MSQIIHIGGVKGVGKTTILRAFPEFYREKTNKEISIVHASELLARLAKENFNKNWSDLNVSEQKSLREEAVRQIKENPAPLVLLDSHYIDLKNGEPVSIMPDEFKKLIDVHVVLEASPEEVLERRIKDGSRKRDIDIDLIKKEAVAEKEVAQKIGTEFGKTVIFVKNDKINEACQSLYDAISPFAVELRETKYEDKIHNV